MTSVRRNVAAAPDRYKTGKANLSGRGSGRAPQRAALGRLPGAWRFPADPAAELMPAAEFLGKNPDIPAILEQFEDSPFDPARRRILGRLMGVFAMDYQGARTEERRFLRRLLAARNAREGYAANRALHLCNAPHAIRRTLALGVAESRQETGPLAGFLGCVQARMAATTFRLLGPRSRELVWSVLTLAGTGPQGIALGDADPVIERALILKALAARRHRVGPWSKDGDEAVEEVLQFGREIRGSKLEHLAAMTTTRAFDPRQAAVLRQERPTTAAAAYRARGDVDPIFAWGENGRIRELANEVATDREPWEVLPELERSPLLDRARLHQALAEARIDDKHPLDSESHALLTDYATGKPVDGDGKARLDAAFRVLEETGFDVVDRDALEAMRTDAQGIYRFDAAKALSDMLSRFTGATYVRRVFSDQLTAGTNPVGQIVMSLQAGMAVVVTLLEQRRHLLKALAVRQGTPMGEDHKLRVDEPSGTIDVFMPASMLTQPHLPELFGKRARAEAYLAPAALDLLAAPFGLPFPELGIEDSL